MHRPVKGKDAARNRPHARSMHRRALLAALALSLPELAQAKSDSDKPVDVGQYVDLSPVGLPIVANGRLLNYVFVYVRINLTSGANVSKLREKEPFFRDALVRAGHRTPFVLPSDYNKINVPALTATLHREAAAITGPGQVRSVVVTSQAPRRRVATPRA